MSDLSQALQAALESVDGRGGGDVTPNDAGVHVLGTQEHLLPPIVSRPAVGTVAATLREQYGPGIAAAWTALRESAALGVLFWVSAVLLTFVEVGGQVLLPGIGDATVTTAALLGALVLRAAFLAASVSSQLIEAHLR